MDKKNSGKKVTELLLDKFDGVKLNTIYKALRKKDILVNGKRIGQNIILNNNDHVRIYILDKDLYKNYEFEIVYQDDNILIVNKPCGIEVLGSNSLTELLIKKFKYSYLRPAHRLDRNTTGLILYAKNINSLNILLKKFKTGEIEKHYRCMVYGIPEKNNETLQAYLFKDSKKSIVYISNKFKTGYNKIETEYKVISKNIDNNTCILDVNLITGRTHQIRAHLAHVKLPIIGDGKYGINKVNNIFRTKTQLLCCYNIKFNFKTDSNILNYLNNKCFNIKTSF